MIKDSNPLVFTERFGVLPVLWGGAFVSLGVAVVLKDHSLGVYVLSKDLEWLLLPCSGLLLIAWEIFRRWRRVTLHVRGEAVEVLRRGVRVTLTQRVNIVPWSTRKNLNDIGRGGILVFLILIPGGAMILLEQGSLKSLWIGGAILALGLGNLASLSYMLLWHWTVEIPYPGSWIPGLPLMLTFRRADVRRLLDGEHSTRPFLEIIRAFPKAAEREPG
jgi:hypothetical protein